MLNEIRGNALYNYLGYDLFISLILLFFHVIQPQITLLDGLPWDAGYYHHMALQFRAGNGAVQGYAPFVYRFLVPCVASLFENVAQGFYIINLVFVSATAWLLLLYLRKSNFETVWITLGLFLYIAHPIVGSRFNEFFPVFTDPGAIFFSFLIIYLFVYSKLSGRLLLVISVLSFVGVLVRETVILSIIAGGGFYLFNCPNVQIKKQWLLLPVVAALMGILVTRIVVDALPWEYSFSSHAWQYLTTNAADPLRYLVALLMTTGPILIMALWGVCGVNKAAVIYCLKIKQVMIPLIYSLLLLPVAFIGGWHTDRFIAWGFVIYLPLLLLGIKQYMKKLPSTYGLLALLLVLIAQFVAFRVFAPLGDMTELDLYNIQLDKIELLVFTPYGEQIEAIYGYSASLPNELRQYIFLQYLLLAGVLGGMMKGFKIDGNSGD